MNDVYLEAVDKREMPRVAGIRERKRTDFSPLTGRISLEGDEPGQVNNYYIGPMHVAVDDLYVISWTAPAAEVFFRNLKTWQSNKVRVQRRFIQKVRKLANYADLWVGRPESEAFPQERADENPPVPRPSGGSKWLAGAKAKAAPDSTPEGPTTSAPRAAPYVAADPPPTTMEDLLRETLAAPRCARTFFRSGDTSTGTIRSGHLRDGQIARRSGACRDGKDHYRNPPRCLACTRRPRGRTWGASYFLGPRRLGKRTSPRPPATSESEGKTFSSAPSTA